MPEPAEPPSELSPSAAAIKAQTDKVLGAATGDNLDAEFKALGWKEGTELDRSVMAPAVAPIAPVTPAAPAAPAAPPAKPEPTKSRVPASLLKKPEASAPTDDDFTLPEGFSDKAQARFKKLVERARTAETWRGEHEPKVKDFETRVKTYEEELAKLKSTPAPAAAPDEVENLRKERDSLDALLKQTAIERHPGFKAKYDDRISEYANTAKKIVGDKNAATLAAILDNPDAEGASDAYDKLVEEIGGFKANQLGVLAANLRLARAERQRELDNWKSNTEAVAQHEKMQALESEKARQTELDVSLKKTMTEITSDNGLFVFRKADGHDEWNQGVDKRLAEVQRIAAKKLTPADQVELAKRAVAADGFDVVLQDVLRERDEALARLAAIEAATPGFRGGGGASPAPEPKDESYADSIIRKAREAGVF